MSLFSRFQISDEVEKARAVERLVKGSTPDFDFFLFVILAVLMATLGLVLDSAAVVIGSMLIAPILYPVLSLALSVVIGDYVLFYRSLYTIFKSVGFAIALALIAALFTGSISETSEIMSRVEPNLAYFMVAVISGFAVAYTLVQPDLNETFPGIAVSVALLPPLAVVGVGIAMLRVDIVFGSLALFSVNVLGILFAALLSFSLMNLSNKKQIASSTLKKEAKRVEEEKRAIEELDQKHNHIKVPPESHE